MVRIFCFRRDATLGVSAFCAGLAAGVGAATQFAETVTQPRVAGQAKPSDGSASAGAIAARALGVIDGDTFEARVAAFPGQEIVTRVRIAGVDAPERNGRCAGETEAAKAATDALSSLIEGRRLTLTAVRGDKYFGRVVAQVSTEGSGDVGKALIAEGHGRAYAGGKRGDWC